jgi:class 3 adenylate cyclase
MATFLSSAAAARFAFALHRRFEQFNQSHGDGQGIVVKVGVHRGPCIAVTLNERLDYFGRTVNAAARIQGMSQGGDVVMSQSCAEEPDVRREVAASGWEARAFEASLRGIGGRTPLVTFARANEWPAPRA